MCALARTRGATSERLRVSHASTLRETLQLYLTGPDEPARPRRHRSGRADRKRLGCVAWALERGFARPRAVGDISRPNRRTSPQP